MANQGDDYTTGCFLHFPYFQKSYKFMARNLSKQQAFDVDPKAMQQINFTGNIDWAGNATMFFIIEEAKGATIFDFHKEVWEYCKFSLI